MPVTSLLYLLVLSNLLHPFLLSGAFMDKCENGTWNTMCEKVQVLLTAFKNITAG